MLKTKSGLPKHCTWNKDRHKVKRVRFLRAGVTGYPKGAPWSPEFMQEYAVLLARTETPAYIGADRAKPGSVNALKASYYKSPEFRSLKPSTQAHRRRIIDRFCAEYGDLPLERMERKHIGQIMAAKVDTPEAANNLIKLLRVMLNYAVGLGMIDSNPCVGIKRYKNRSDGFHIWTEDEIAQFEARHPVGTKPRLALASMLYTSQRVSDACTMGWQHVIKTVDGDAIKVKQRKTGKTLEIPLHPELKAILAMLPKTNMTFIVNERGAPFSAAGLGSWFKEQCRVAGLPHCSAHGLRKAAVTRLVDAGCSDEQIMAVTGHQSASALAPYKRAGNQRLLARQAMNMQLGSEGERKLSNLQPQIIQPRVKS